MSLKEDIVGRIEPTRQLSWLFDKDLLLLQDVNPKASRELRYEDRETDGRCSSWLRRTLERQRI